MYTGMPCRCCVAATVIPYPSHASVNHKVAACCLPCEVIDVDRRYRPIPSTGDMYNWLTGMGLFRHDQDPPWAYTQFKYYVSYYVGITQFIRYAICTFYIYATQGMLPKVYTPCFRIWQESWNIINKFNVHYVIGCQDSNCNWLFCQSLVKNHCLIFKAEHIYTPVWCSPKWNQQWLYSVGV